MDHTDKNKKGFRQEDGADSSTAAALRRTRVLQDPNTGASQPTNDRQRQRRERALKYFEEDLDNQRKWYGTKASSYKSYDLWLSTIIIVAGATITFVQLFAPGPSHVAAITAALGGVVVIIKGAQRIWRFENMWPTYRRASERMKRERRLYTNIAEQYTICDEEAAYRRFVETVEQIVAEEQQLYWQSHQEEQAEGQDGSRDKLS